MKQTVGDLQTWPLKEVPIPLHMTTTNGVATKESLGIKSNADFQMALDQILRSQSVKSGLGGHLRARAKSINRPYSTPKPRYPYINELEKRRIERHRHEFSRKVILSAGEPKDQLVTPKPLKRAASTPVFNQEKCLRELSPKPLRKRSSSSDFMDSEGPSMGAMFSQKFTIPKKSALARYKKQWAATTQSPLASSRAPCEARAREPTLSCVKPQDKKKEDKIAEGVQRNEKETLHEDQPRLSDLALLLSMHLKTAKDERAAALRTKTIIHEQLMQDLPVLTRCNSKLAKSA